MIAFKKKGLKKNSQLMLPDEYLGIFFYFENALPAAKQIHRA